MQHPITLDLDALQLLAALGLALLALAAGLVIRGHAEESFRDSLCAGCPTCQERGREWWIARGRCPADHWYFVHGRCPKCGRLDPRNH